MITIAHAMLATTLSMIAIDTRYPDTHYPLPDTPIPDNHPIPDTPDTLVPRSPLRALFRVGLPVSSVFPVFGRGSPFPVFGRCSPFRAGLPVPRFRAGFSVPVPRSPFSVGVPVLGGREGWSV